MHPAKTELGRVDAVPEPVRFSERIEAATIARLAVETSGID